MNNRKKTDMTELVIKSHITEARHRLKLAKNDLDQLRIGAIPPALALEQMEADCETLIETIHALQVYFCGSNHT